MVKKSTTKKIEDKPKKSASIASKPTPSIQESVPKNNFSERFSRALGWTLWIIFTFFAANFIMALFIMVMRHHGFTIDLRAGTAVPVVINATMYILMFVIAVLVPIRWRNRKKPNLERTKVKSILEQIGLSRGVKLIDIRYFLADLPVFYLVSLVAAGIAAYFLGSEIMGQEQNIGFTTFGNNTWQLMAIFLALVIVAPLFEEIVLRGFLFTKLRKNMPFWPMAILISLLFAVAHGQINVGIMTFIMSMFCCWIREKTGSIWGAIFLHAFNNGLAFYLLFIM